MKTYTSFEEIEEDLKVLKLRRDIAMEEIKYTKHQIQNDLKPVNWMHTVFGAIKKYGILYVVRKMFN